MLGLHVLGWCVLGCLTIHVHLGGKYPLYDLSLLGVSSPCRGTPLSGTGHVQADDAP